MVYKMTKEHREKISKALRGHSISNSTRQKISKSLKYPKSHGLSYHRLYPVWRAMLNRCLNPNNIAYFLYKGRGVCKRWLSIENFLDDMMDTYFDGATIDRIDNTKGYYPENCRWITHSENMRNRRNTIFVEHEGKKKTISEWSNILKIPYYSIYNKVRVGMKLSEIIKNYAHSPSCE